MIPAGSSCHLYSLSDWAYHAKVRLSIPSNGEVTAVQISGATSHVVVDVLSEGGIIRVMTGDVSIYSPVRKVVHRLFRYLREPDMKRAAIFLKEGGCTRTFTGREI